MAIPFLSDAVGLLTSNTVMFIVFELVLFFVSAIFIWIGARIADVEKDSIVRSFIIAILVAIIVPLLLIPFHGLALVSIVLSVVLTLAIIKLVFSTGWKKSLVTWVFSIIAEIVALVLLIVLLFLIV